ncbi:TetR/AcrR family transcriptional regulator [Cochleicola gelatinilyticus]|uniref:TetR family transcriptional regulator n=1 Tax=Cochleicola gelatinilyticus TaxID=1763537 RepID=A0A167JGL9_9FLAO|nr:TetR/AcrR family transcriptional regulator [Cochleicola gelatinilyticus]OAB80645.1 TetR family transcriptional regulator [Cochleicola gelatinilyticus]
MKEKIINKAADLFITLGFKSVTMDDIANEMGISKKTIYAHFSNKTDLVKDVTSTLMCDISEGIDGICALNNNPIEELYEIKKFVLLQLKDSKSSPQYQLQKYYPQIFASLHKKQFEMMRECTVSNLTRGIEQGLYRDNISVDLISRLYFIGVSNLKDESLFPLQTYPKEQLMEDYLEYHLRGIVTKEGLQTLKKFIKNK